VKRPRLGVAELRLEPRVVDRRGAQARRGTGLEPSEREPELGERLREIDRRELAGAAGAVTGEAHVNQAAQEGAGRRDHGARAVPHADLVLDARDAPAFENEARRLALPHLEVRFALDRTLHRAAVAGAVALRTRGAYRRPARGIERLELDRGAVGVLAHLAAERVDLADQMALGGAADGRVAGHLTDRVEVHREEQRPATHAC
jgi:hypothetical protein